MLVLAAFLLICAVGVAFLLRFIYALESSLRARRKHPARVERIHTYRVPARYAGESVVPAPVLVHSNLELPRRARRGMAAAGVRANENPAVKQA